MRIVRAALRPFALPLVHPIATAHGVLKARAGYLVSLEDASGRVGQGEATPLPEFGTEDFERCGDALRRGLADLVGADSALDFDSAGEGAADLRAGQSIEAIAPCARSAIDAARLALSASAEDRSIAEALRARAQLEGAPLDRIAVQALIQGASPADVEASALAALGQGFEAFKLKLAVSSERRDVSHDLERVAALRATVGASGRIRLDANEAWTREEAEQAFARLAEYSVDYVEQPVARGAISGLAALSAAGIVGVAADEALLGDGLSRVLEARAASVLVVKPAALGGLFPSLSLVRRAREEGLRIVWSNLFEGAVGRSLAIALAAATSPAEEVHGLGTAQLLACDFPSAEAGAGAAAEGAIDVSRALASARAISPAWSCSGEIFDDQGACWEMSA